MGVGGWRDNYPKEREGREIGKRGQGGSQTRGRLTYEVQVGEQA